MSRSMAAQPSDRLAWFVSTLEVAPHHTLLELGCGHGVAVSLVAGRLAGGHIVGLDRSAKMTAMAGRRNAEAVAAGRASFVTAAIESAHFPARRFDLVCAMHVGLFLRGTPAAALARIAGWLKPGGRLCLAYQPLHACDLRDTADRVARNLVHGHFRVGHVIVQVLSGGPAVCVVAMASVPTR